MPTNSILKYDLVGNIIKFDKPLKKHKNGIKILFYREPHIEMDSTDYPVAYADTKKGMTEISLPDDSIQLFEVEVKVPRYWFFPFIWHKFIIITPQAKKKLK